MLMLMLMLKLQLNLHLKPAAATTAATERKIRAAANVSSHAKCEEKERKQKIYWKTIFKSIYII